MASLKNWRMAVNLMVVLPFKIIRLDYLVPVITILDTIQAPEIITLVFNFVHVMAGVNNMNAHGKRFLSLLRLYIFINSLKPFNYIYFWFFWLI